MKLLDFGMAAGVEEELNDEDDFVFGTKGYVPPEIYLLCCENKQAVDSWSLGVLLYNLVCGAMPFRGDKGKVIKQTLDPK